MIPPDIHERYLELQRYVGWTSADKQAVRAAFQVIEPHLNSLIEDFYQEVQRHPRAARVIRGGHKQIQTLKKQLRTWLHELFSGEYDRDYVSRRWRVGWRHVEIGLEQVYTCSALSRLRIQMLTLLHEHGVGSPAQLLATTRALNRLMDLDAAIICDAYQNQSVADEKERREAVFRNLVETAGSLIIILRLDRSVAYINPSTEHLTGLRLSEIRGQSYSTFLRPQDACGDFDAGLSRVLDDNVLNAPFDSALMDHEGERRWITWNARVVEDYQNEPGILLIGHDITERRQAEERAVRSERLAAIGQMVTGLAHESRNAFQRSQACLEMLELELEGQAETLDLVKRIQNAQDHLHHLYEEVRDYAAPIRLNREECHLGQIWRDTWTNLEFLRKGKEIVLREEISASDAVVDADPHAIEQLLRNVLENAIDACEESGEVLLICEESTLGGQPALRVRIVDSGPGFNASAMEKVFEPFYTTKTKGTGLGMAIAQRIVEAHGGRIQLDNSRQAGAEVCVLLPRNRPANLAREAQG